MKSVIFDIDGTLADVEHRRVHLPNWNKFFAEMDKDPVIQPVVDLLNLIVHNMSGVKVLIVSARPDTYMDVTVNWLKSNGIMYHGLYMRKDADYRKDSIVKAEILQNIMDDGYVPFLVVDDRPEVVAMWRSFGITTLQCAPDEIQPKHEGKCFLDILVGPSGAGKSTYASKNPSHCIISTDQIREDNGWGHSPEDLGKTWRLAHGMMKVRLENHLYTVFDATNLKKKDRMTLLSHVPKGQYVNYMVIDRPLEDKLANRGWRSEELILKHDKTFRSQLKDILKGDDLPNVVVNDLRKTK